MTLPLFDRIIPLLPTYVRLSIDPLTQRPLLLYPEGVLELEETASAVLSLCDGHRSLPDISALLAEEYDAPAEEISADTIGYLRELEAKGLVRLESRAHGE